MKKGEFGFVWLFAIIAGIAILVLVIYGAVRIGETTRVQTDASIAKQISILTDTLEAGFAAAVKGDIKFQQDTIIRNVCHDIGFGENSISALSKSDVGKDYLDFTVSSSVSDKYIFSFSQDEGKNFYILSKSFDFPYKIADYIILISNKRKYCFKNTPDYIKDELEALELPFVSFDNCSQDLDTTLVCFGEQGCDISVFGECDYCQDIYGGGTVVKRTGSVHYVGNLLYPAIFSDRIIYECNINRMLYRGSITGKVLARKAQLMNTRGCTTNLEPVLYSWSLKLGNSTYNDILKLHPDVLKIQDVNRQEACGVW